MKQNNHNNSALVAVYSAQFLSAFADNALLICAIALLKSLEQSAAIPWLQSVFVLPFVLLAPFVGVFADSLPKGRVMMIGNALKLVGAIAFIFNASPLFAYALVGIGAAIYSPAKYGILSQLVTNNQLVTANAWMEGSTLVAILLGVVLGGLLADWSITNSFILLVIVYCLAALINRFIPTQPVEHPYQGESMWFLVRAFIRQVNALWQHPVARTTLIGTSAFWATGSTLRLMLFAWVPVALLVSDNQLPATLMGMVSIGIMLGAGLAAWRLAPQQLGKALLGGMIIGPLLILLAYTNDLTIAIALLIAVGAAGGWFIVPLNAALQQHGQASIGTGRALAVQNLWENIAMFAAVSFYGLVINRIDIITLIIGLAVAFTSILLLLKRRSRN
ncbi:MAG: lysophospholipid transporter LplT [Thiotrichales bacterium]|jgi:LPLT family lysophospholipid transporter-like MFS transporter|nr:lysophospholipid transporter LplT [Thiotrichales bacterium]